MYTISLILCICAYEFPACASHVSKGGQQFLQRRDNELTRKNRNIEPWPDDKRPSGFWNSFRDSYLEHNKRSARHVEETSIDSAEESPGDTSAAVSGLHNPMYKPETYWGAGNGEHQDGHGTADDSKHDDWPPRPSGYHPSLDARPAPGIPEFQSHEFSRTASADAAAKSEFEVTKTTDDSGIHSDLLSRNPSTSATTDDASNFYLKFLDTYTKQTHTKQTETAGSRAKEDSDKDSRDSGKYDSQGPDAQIPHQLVCTGSADMFEQLAEPIQANIRKTLEMNPGFELRYFGDKACYAYLTEHFAATHLAKFYKNESHGMYRGDICRAAVLAHEGGFYTDLDLEMSVPFRQMVDPSVTFVSARSVDGDILNALMGVTPGNVIMKKMLVELENWYAGPSKGYLGTQAALLALHDLEGEECTGVELNDVSRADIQCGAENVRILQEMSCEDSREGCPEIRKPLALKYGIYTSHGDQVGWSRFSECADFGCAKQGGTGRILLLPELNDDGAVLMQMFSTGKSTALRSLKHEASANAQRRF